MTEFNNKDKELLQECGITTDTILTAVEYGAEPIKRQITAEDFYRQLMASILGTDGGDGEKV